MGRRSYTEGDMRTAMFIAAALGFVIGLFL